MMVMRNAESEARAISDVPLLCAEAAVSELAEGFTVVQVPESGLGYGGP